MSGPSLIAAAGRVEGEPAAGAYRLEPDAEPADGFVTVRCPEHRLCGPAADRFARAAAALCRPGVELAVDLSPVAAVDAVGLRALAGLTRAAAAAGGSLRFCCPTRDVRLLLAASGLCRSVEVFWRRPGRPEPSHS